MPGLSFLTKKSWHTRTIQNIEKKWIAEQKHAEEQKKILELQKQRQEEREMMNMRNHARKGEKIVERVDWMYQGMAQQQKKKEEMDVDAYLLGKRIEEKKDSTNVQRTAIEAKWYKKTNTKNEQFQKIQEDPLEYH